MVDPYSRIAGQILSHAEEIAEPDSWNFTNCAIALNRFADYCDEAAIDIIHAFTPLIDSVRGGEVASYQSHNLEVAGSTTASAIPSKQKMIVPNIDTKVISAELRLEIPQVFVGSVDNPYAMKDGLKEMLLNGRLIIAEPEFLIKLEKLLIESYRPGAVYVEV